MRLTQYTDYSLRVLIYLGFKKDENVTISELADFYHISRNHLVKVVHNLGLNGYIQTIRGKNGGLKLAHPPGEIIIGDVVRSMEPDFNLLECFNPAEDTCVITRTCALKSVLVGARNTFLEELDKYTLADAIKPAAKSSPAFKSIPVVHG
jgi:Rrf2 family nitric oxide-sensitive transcriptional repressor